MGFRNRLERLKELYHAVQKKDGLTQSELAQKLGVSDRTIREDINILKEYFDLDLKYNKSLGWFIEREKNDSETSVYLVRTHYYGTDGSINSFLNGIYTEEGKARKICIQNTQKSYQYLALPGTFDEHSLYWLTITSRTLNDRFNSELSESEIAVYLNGIERECQPTRYNGETIETIVALLLHKHDDFWRWLFDREEIVMWMSLRECLGDFYEQYCYSPKDVWELEEFIEEFNYLTIRTNYNWLQRLHQRWSSNDRYYNVSQVVALLQDVIENLENDEKLNFDIDAIIAQEQEKEEESWRQQEKSEGIVGIVARGRKEGKDAYTALQEAGYISDPIEDFFS